MKIFVIKYRNREVKLTVQNCNARNIGRFFKVSSEDVYLTNNGQAEFPDNSGMFNLDSYANNSIFQVVASSDPDPPISSHTLSTSTPTPAIQPAASQSSRTPRRVIAIVRVIRADLSTENGKPTNIHAHNLTAHVNIYNEQDACVGYILEKVKTSMDDDNLVLVGPNGLIIYDQEGTRGVTFWKVGSRKVYAVHENDLESHRSNYEETSSPLPKRRRISTESLSRGSSGHAEEVLENLVTEVSDIKGHIEVFQKLAFKHHFSMSFLRSVEETFVCSICKRIPPKTPLVACKACSSLVGCQRCTDTLYVGVEGMRKPCPKCRAPRGLANSFILRGLDEFIEQVATMMKSDDEENTSDSESTGPFDDTLPIVVPADD